MKFVKKLVWSEGPVGLFRPFSEQLPSDRVVE